jgi:hypothetical protein
MSRTSITYRLPGGLQCTYSGAPKPYYRWFLDTWDGAFALWRMWLRAAFRMALHGQMPWPKDVSGEVPRFWRRLLWEVRTNG